ncbi:PQQ-binding-like beta-propeller repeat protein, partial [Salmonella enterica subsp. enterica serovar Give]|nr:PQQ-binding-like beta-propeller repeat protein [Salmonella enterica subsp. enterica serovar Give]
IAGAEDPRFFQLVNVIRSDLFQRRIALAFLITSIGRPVFVGDTLYLCTAHQRLFALDAASGKEKWHFDPQLKTDSSFQHVT